MICFFRKEELVFEPDEVGFSQGIDLFDPKTGISWKGCSLQILPNNASQRQPLEYGIAHGVAKVVSGDRRDEVVEIYYAAHESLGCFDTFPLKERLRAQLVLQLTELVQARMYLIPG